jgi:hypothetical protein
VSDEAVSDEADSTTNDDSKTLSKERWTWLDGLLWFFDAIVYAIVGVVRLIAWAVAGILSSCS